MSGPTPGTVRGGRVVRLLGRHRTWTSGSMPSAEAESRTEQLAREIAGIGDGAGLIFFRCSDGREAFVRARDLLGVEHQACTEAPRPAGRTPEEIADAVVRP